MKTALFIWLYSSLGFFIAVLGLNVLRSVKTPWHRIPLIIMIGLIPIISWLALITLAYEAFYRARKRQTKCETAVEEV